MIGMRVTNQMQLDTVMNAFQVNEQALELAQQRVTTGHNVSQPSDDPFAASQAILFRQRIDLNGQLQTNLNSAKGWLDATDSALNSIDNVLQRARQVALQLSNDTYTDADRKNAANEIHQLLLQAVDVGNSKVGGQYLFAGTKTTQQPFIQDGSAQSPNLSAGGRAPVIYTGDTGAVTRQTDQAAQLQVNVSGDHLKNVFDDIAQLEWDLNNSSARSSGAITGIDPVAGTTSGVLGVTADTFAINGVPMGDPLNPVTVTINGAAHQVIGFAQGTPISTVINQINAQSNQTGVTASIDRNGVLVLQNPTPGAKPIVVSLVDQLTQDAAGNDLTQGSGVPVDTNGSTARDLGLSNQIDNTLGSVDIVSLDSDLDSTQALRAQIGAKTNRVDDSQTRLSSLGITLTQLDSSIEDVDIAKAISELASRQTAFQAALGVAAKTLPPTLLDFLR
jgi:flagellar hook-associated protein 3 FlgL